MAENTPSPFSTSQASPKLKQHSLNIISPGPRPLHLISGSVLSSPSYSPSRMPALHNSSTDFPVSETSQHRAGPLSPLGASSVKNGRRQSSISYLPSSRDKDRPVSLLSPLSPSGFSRGMALTSGSSAAARVGSPNVELEMEQGRLHTSKGLKERPPATLVEKHAELLHFIAQKESKCLELRSQLATHEAELLQLKRKWERIVNRGFDKTSSSSLPLPSISSTTPTSYLHSSSLTTNTTSNSSGVVLEGIKEGVQGMSRLITAGLESIAQVGVAEGNTPVSPAGTPSHSSGSRKQSSKFPVPLRLGSISNYGHESQSSSSTSASFTTVASSSTSATSLMLEHGTTQVRSPPLTSDEVHDEFGDFEEAASEQDENPEQVLMVHDTGATPTMSPNPHFQGRSRMKVEQQDPPCDISAVNSGWDDGWTTSGASTTIDNFTSSSSQARTSSSSSITHTIQPVPTKPPKIKKPSSSGISSVPGVASSSMPINGTTPQLMSTWVGSMGKKWGEIRESQTFTKSQKRASILLSDVSHSIVSAFVSPPLSASSRSVTTSKSLEENPFSTNAFQAPSLPPSPSHSLKPDSTTTTNNTEVPISTSLLDDLDGGEVDDALKLGIGSPVLIPDQTSKNKLNPGRRLEGKIDLDMNIVPGVPSSNSIDDEDWSWG